MWTRAVSRGLSSLLVIMLASCRSGEQKTSPAPVVSGRTWQTPPIQPAEGNPIAKGLPQIAHWGGPILRNARIFTVTFKQDDPAIVARVELFGDTITKTEWWHEVVDAYCLGPTDCIGEGRPGPHVHLGDVLPADLTDVQLEAILDREIKANQIGPVEPDESLLMVYLPKDVKFTAGGKSFCAPNSPRALHHGFEIAPQRKIALAIIPRCSDEAELTAAASHELVESVTNPDVQKRGFSFKVVKNVNAAFFHAGIEPVDPCGFLNSDNHWTFAGGFAVQRAWSNRAASLGHDPCVPARPNRPYLTLIPQDTSVRGRIGEPATIAVTAHADRPVSRWSVSAFDITGHERNEPLVDLSFDKAMVANGETLTLTVTIKKPLQGGTSRVGLLSSAGATTHLWPLTVLQVN